MLISVGPQSTEINSHSIGQRCIACKYTDPGQCVAGHDKERYGVCQLSSFSVSHPEPTKNQEKDLR
jgi:hypothetical protein